MNVSMPKGAGRKVLRGGGDGGGCGGGNSWEGDNNV